MQTPLLQSLPKSTLFPSLSIISRNQRRIAKHAFHVLMMHRKIQIGYNGLSMNAEQRDDEKYNSVIDHFSSIENYPFALENRFSAINHRQLSRRSVDPSI